MRLARPKRLGVETAALGRDIKGKIRKRGAAGRDGGAEGKDEAPGEKGAGVDQRGQGLEGRA